jgi:hypothetical protein
MKKIILAALTVMSLGAGVANAQSYSHENAQMGQHTGAYDNTGRGPQQTGLEGGGG